MSAQGARLKSFEFRREREGSWHELEDLVTRIEKKGLTALAPFELERLPVLYRSALSSLSVARSISLDENVTEYLEGLAGRAYFCVYGTRTPLRNAVWRFFSEGFPRAVRDARWQIAVSAGVMLLAAVAAFVLTAADPDRYYDFVSSGMAQGRDPASTTEELRDGLYEVGTETDALAAFSSFLFTHNSRVAMLAFALGFLLGLPTFLVLFVNGLTLGAFTALYHGRGLSLDVWGWLLPHGVTELLAVILCGGAGLILAQSLVLPGRRSRLRNLAVRGREAALIVIGSVAMLFIAGLLEGFFRQLVTDIVVRYAVAGSTLLFWILYFGFAGRQDPAEAEP